MATPKRITEPASPSPADAQSPQPAAERALNSAVRLLIGALGLNEEDVRGIDVRNKVVRVYGADNSARSYRTEPFRKEASA